MKFWCWFLQRATGLLIVVLAFIHVCLAYFGAQGDAITFDAVQLRVNSATFWVDILLLYSGLFHGLYGLYVVIADLVPAIRGRYLAGSMAVVGFLFAVMGTQTLTALLS